MARLAENTMMDAPPMRMSFGLCDTDIYRLFLFIFYDMASILIPGDARACSTWVHLSAFSSENSVTVSWQQIEGALALLHDLIRVEQALQQLLSLPIPAKRSCGMETSSFIPAWGSPSVAMVYHSSHLSLIF
jgi:hypothetical protein